MGYLTRTLRKVMLATNKYVDPKESVLVELGAQNAFNNLMDDNRGTLRVSELMGRYFKEYHSLDLTNEPNVKMTDLSVYQPGLFVANIITNIGTTEHVEYQEGQWNCWRNIHNWLKVGGIMIHELPEVGNWPGHCRYYVSKDFFKSLEKFGYQILEMDDNLFDLGNTVWCVIRKVEDKPFMSYQEFFDVMHFEANTPPAGTIPTNNPKNLR